MNILTINKLNNYSLMLKNILIFKCKTSYLVFMYLSIHVPTMYQSIFLFNYLNL